MCAPTLRRGAFFVAGAAWVLHAHPAMRGGEYTATAGMGHDEACRQQAEWVRIGRRSAAADSRPALPLRQRARLPSPKDIKSRLARFSRSRRASWPPQHARLKAKRSEDRDEHTRPEVWLHLGETGKSLRGSGGQPGSRHRSATHCSREWRKSGLSRSVFGQLLLSARSPLCRSPGSADL
jgi:hypothetical protein